MSQQKLLPLFDDLDRSERKKIILRALSELDKNLVGKPYHDPHHSPITINEVIKNYGYETLDPLYIDHDLWELADEDRVHMVEVFIHPNIWTTAYRIKT